MSTAAATILERITLPAPFGVVFRDIATGMRVDEGLAVTLTGAGGRSVPVAVNRSGVWFARNLPGVADAVLSDTADWTTLGRDYRLEVRDTLGRFLPLAVTVRLPHRGLYAWPGWSALPRPLLMPLVDVPPNGTIADGWLPLFSAATRSIPAPMAEVRATLVDRTRGDPAAWALVTASHDGRTRGLGMAGADGQIALFFPYPPLPQPGVADSPPAITDYRWPLTLAAYTQALPPGATPDLAALAAQLTHPATLYAATTEPPEALPAQAVSLGRALTLRTTATPGGPTSALFLGTD
jgi:hypothetical protein